VWVSVSATPAQFLGFEPKVPLASSASDLGGLIGMPAPSDPYDAAYVASIAVSDSALFAPGVGVVPERSIPSSEADVAALTLAGYPEAAVEEARASCGAFVVSTDLVDACALDVLVTGDVSFANSYSAVSEYERPSESGVDVKGPSGSSNPFGPAVAGAEKKGESNTGQIIFFVVLVVVLALCGGYVAFVALSRRKKKQALAAGAAADVEAQVKSKVSEAGDKVKGAEDKVDAAKEVVEDKVEEVKEVVQKERKRKRRHAAKKVVEEVVEVEEVKVDVAAKAEAVKDAVDDVVGDDGIGLVDVEDAAGFVEAKGLAEGVEDAVDSFGSSFYSDVEEASRNVGASGVAAVAGTDGYYSDEYYSDDQPCVDAGAEPLPSQPQSSQQQPSQQQPQPQPQPQQQP